jgi:uncharacterized membrane protein AbrB (regulator of aidB expression)
MKKKENMPSWAYWGLWGIKSRKAALAFFVVSVILSLLIIPIAIMIGDYISAIIVLAPIWYWLSIRWADKNSAWNSSDNL